MLSFLAEKYMKNILGCTNVHWYYLATKTSPKCSSQGVMVLRSVAILKGFFVLFFKVITVLE